MGGHVFDLTNAKDTALHRAAKNGHLPMVEHLVKVTGFNVKDKNKVCTVFPLGAFLRALSTYAMMYSTLYNSSLLYLMAGMYNNFIVFTCMNASKCIMQCMY